MCAFIGSQESLAGGAGGGPVCLLLLAIQVGWRFPEIRIPLVTSFRPEAAKSICMLTEIMYPSPAVARKDRDPGGRNTAKPLARS